MSEQKQLILIVLIALCLGLPLGRQTAKKYGHTTYAHGLNYYGPVSPTPTLAVSDWISLSGRIFPYLLTYPKSLNLVQFPNDPNDSIGLGGPQKLILFVEKISGSPKEFVTNYWRLYSGLSGLKSLKEFQNPAGITGFEANYTYKGAVGQSTDIFLIIPKDKNHLIHLMKGELEESLFRQIVNRFQYKDEQNK